jgi:hypothetical protein
LILYRLEAVDLRRMTDEEKIAFWVNIHNGLLMHVVLLSLTLVFTPNSWLCVYFLLIRSLCTSSTGLSQVWRPTEQSEEVITAC